MDIFLLKTNIDFLYQDFEMMKTVKGRGGRENKQFNHQYQTI